MISRQGHRHPITLNVCYFDQVGSSKRYRGILCGRQVGRSGQYRGVVHWRNMDINLGGLAQSRSPCSNTYGINFSLGGIRGRIAPRSETNSALGEFAVIKIQNFNPIDTNDMVRTLR